MRASKWIPWLIFGAALIGVALAFATFFEQIPTDQNTLAMDWKGYLWPGLRDGLPYTDVNGTVRNPPWTVIPLLPLGQMSMRASWGILSLITLVILLISVPRVPRRSLYWISVLALIFSLPSIRNLVDGNVEALSIAGVLALLYGYRRENPLILALGILFAVAKPQVTSLLMLALGLYVFQSRPPRLWLMTAILVVLVATPALWWRGEQWLAMMFGIPEKGSIMDLSLMAALERTGWLPAALNRAIWLGVIGITGGVTWLSKRSLTREKAGMLIAASLLVAPYAASTLTLVAIGVVPFFQKNRLWGGVLLLLAFAQVFLNTAAAVGIFAYYSTAFVGITWVVLLWHVWRTEIHAPAPVPAAPPVMAG
ncbi:MAG: DUF2029 domain-containing protein [Anaerolineae bacterium]|nr:DUF2029 domain-containing protein [Anaerolineae bacterium]